MNVIIYFFNVTAINAFQVRDPKPMGNEALEDQSTSAYTDERDNWPDLTPPIQAPELMSTIIEPVVAPEPTKQVVAESKPEKKQDGHR